MKSEEERTTAGGRGLYRDLHNLQQNGSASLGELKEFLNKLQGRSPQEVVGLVSTSMLVQSMVISVVGTLAILLIFTLGPYMIYGPPKEKKTAAAPPPATAPATAATPVAAEGKPGELTDEGKTKAMQKMGIDETKTTDPKVNPLENLDNLLEGLK